MECLPCPALCEDGDEHAVPSHELTVICGGAVASVSTATRASSLAALLVLVEHNRHIAIPGKSMKATLAEHGDITCEMTKSDCFKSLQKSMAESRRSCETGAPEGKAKV